MEWWREARFGMFIHWGLYAIPAGEWNDENEALAGVTVICSECYDFVKELNLRHDHIARNNQ